MFHKSIYLHIVVEHPWVVAALLNIYCFATNNDETTCYINIRLYRDNETISITLFHVLPANFESKSCIFDLNAKESS